MRNASRPKATQSKKHTRHNTTKAPRFRYPSSDTLPAIPLALMLQGRAVSTPSMTFSQLAATRLPAYIEQLRDMGLGEAIIKGDLPLTPRQRMRKHSKPFAVYHLPPAIIDALGGKAQAWALAVLELHGVHEKAFPHSADWIAWQRGGR